MKFTGDNLYRRRRHQPLNCFKFAAPPFKSHELRSFMDLNTKLYYLFLKWIDLQSSNFKLLNSHNSKCIDRIT